MLKTEMTNRIVDLVFFIALITLFVFLYKTKRSQEDNLNKGMIVVNFWNPSNSLPFDSTHGDYKRVSLTGVKQSDSLKMAEIKEHLKGFKAKVEEVNGIHVMFTGNSKYGDFIEVLDYCLQEDIERYIPYKNNLWILANGNLIR
ncbi:hypothetical protein [Rufibacter hautae]|uniref:Biopolymer transporter ExbD n=1 Tax=Rufibacter hautae TaxID=2595005 RepID=A0A5B6TF58_9BACT|nr:hypothetical protein [Rufibacter hautae]KAA3439244.1 hypothetical protein FOA19_00735 [Rufibacter hautae]